MKLLDLFCGAGGAAMGYYRAGFTEIVGVDLSPQPNYPFTFIQANAVEDFWPIFYDMTFNIGVDAIHASPPCQAFSWAAKRWNKEWPDLVAATRELLQATGKPYVIENVQGAPLINPITLCGEMFGLGVLRHRLFESNVFMLSPTHQPHKKPVTLPRRDGKAGVIQHTPYCSVAGNGGNSISFRLEDWRQAMGIDWMNKKELVQSIPPAYTEYIGRQLMEVGQ